MNQDIYMYIFPSFFWNAISLTVIGKDRLLLAIQLSGQKANWREALFCTMCTPSIYYATLNATSSKVYRAEKCN